MQKITSLTVNETLYQTDADDDRTLLSVLRDDLDLTGTKYGCGEAQCGACLVLIDGHRTPSCITAVAEAAGKSVTTIEGLERDGRLHPLQEAFLELGAFQCGFCTPGMIVASLDLLQQNPDPDEAAIKAALQTNVCRCGAHTRIVAAVRRASETMRKGAV
jgi:aerobic-type carbon monoxide dehydrogenase small subunit (CoxS/CutS family)